MKNAEERSETNPGGCIWTMAIRVCQKKLLMFALWHFGHCSILVVRIFYVVFFALFQNFSKTGNILATLLTR